MKREWKPGDVAMVTVEGFKPEVAVFTESGTWHDASDMRLNAGSPDTTYRPLVVIDPEDREAVERFREIASRWSDQVPYSDMREAGDMDHTDAMQAALREFANPAPPKPDEPQGLGAVVEDADGDYWVYVGNRTALSDTRIWQHARNELVFDEISVVRILSEGVTQ